MDIVPVVTNVTLTEELSKKLTPRQPSSASVFEDIAARVDRARGLIEYKENLKKKLDVYGDGSNVSHVVMEVEFRTGAHQVIESHAEIMRSGIGYEDRLLESMKYVFHKCIEVEIQTVEAELKDLNVGL